jgi:hypothetical protein
MESCNSFGEYHHIGFLDDNEREHKKLLEYLKAKNHQNIEFQITAPTVEDCFINLMH